MESPQNPSLAMRKRTAPVITVFVASALLVTGLDLWSKKAVFEALEVITVRDSEGRPYVAEQTRVVVIENLFELEANYNYGAFSGWFSRHTGVLALVSALALAVISAIFAYHVRKARAPEIVFALSLGLLLGGTLGNLYDRAMLSGVRDWIKWFTVVDGEPWVWPNFNIADSGICVGVGLLIIREIRIGLRERRIRRQPEGPAEEDKKPAAARPSGT